MKRRDPKDDGIMHGSKPNTITRNKKKKKKNIQRLGGTALSLEAFANAKSTNQHHNPAFKKKRREFYKNAKYVSRYRKSQKQHTSQQNVASSSVEPAQDQNETTDGSEMNISLKKKKKKKKKQSLEELYEKKHEEEERARRERDAIFQAKKEEREKAEAQRKELRSKMFKKTRHGQPVMKYRIEHLLQTLQGSSKNSANNNG